jgi:hypothetical protein
MRIRCARETQRHRPCKNPVRGYHACHYHREQPRLIPFHQPAPAQQQVPLVNLLQALAIAQAPAPLNPTALPLQPHEEPFHPKPLPPQDYLGPIVLPEIPRVPAVPAVPAVPQALVFDDADAVNDFGQSDEEKSDEEDSDEEVSVEEDSDEEASDEEASDEEETDQEEEEDEGYRLLIQPRINVEDVQIAVSVDFMDNAMNGEVHVATPNQEPGWTTGRVTALPVVVPGLDLPDHLVAHCSFVAEVEVDEYGMVWGFDEDSVELEELTVEHRDDYTREVFVHRFRPAGARRRGAVPLEH